MEPSSLSDLGKSWCWPLGYSFCTTLRALGVGDGPPLQGSVIVRAGRPKGFVWIPKKQSRWTQATKRNSQDVPTCIAPPHFPHYAWMLLVLRPLLWSSGSFLCSCPPTCDLSSGTRSQSLGQSASVPCTEYPSALLSKLPFLLFPKPLAPSVWWLPLQFIRWSKILSPDDLLLSYQCQWEFSFEQLVHPGW